MNYLQLRERLGRRLGITREEFQNPEEWEMMGETLNEGVIDILSRTRLHVKCLILTLIPDEDEYELGDEILRLYNVGLDGEGDLAQHDAADLQRMQGEHVYAILGYNRLRTGWTPSEGTLKAWYTPQPTPMSEDGHDPSQAQYGNIPPEFHSVLLDYASWQMADAAGDTGSQRGEAYRMRYEGKAGTGEIGSGLGRIKYAINKRVSGGSATHRMSRSEGYVTSDIEPGFWQG